MPALPPTPSQLVANPYSSLRRATDASDVLVITRLTAAVTACLLCCLMIAVGGPAAAAGNPTAETSTAVSSNWAGYVAQLGHVAGSRFARVSGIWTVPSVICVRGHASYSAVWVGLGGYQETASSLEQVGVDSDCSAGGHPSYTSWYELLPAAPISLKLKIRPGNQIAASVTAKGHRVTLRLRNLTSSKRFGTSRRARRIDLSSAEWIVEAPSECTSSEACSTLALSNFGDVLFTNASATARGHTGPISDPLWSATALDCARALARTWRCQQARRQP